MRKTLAILLAGMLFVAAMPAAMAEDGTYTGTANGIGAVTVNITVTDGKITEATVDTSNETPSIGLELGEGFAAQIVEKGTIDAVAGATVTSSAAQAALTRALMTAGLAATTVAGYTPGTYTGTAMGRIGEITVEVTVTGEAITSVAIGENTETPAMAALPFEQIPAEIVAYQSLAVDTVTGATITSAGVINAVADALAKAGADISALRAAAVPEAEAAPVSDMTTQIVVVGGGMSGMIAAISAKQKGADVVLVEKLPFMGGTLAVSAGGGVVVGSKHSPAEVENPADMAWIDASMQDANFESGRQVDAEFAKGILAQSGRAIDYLMDEIGLAYTVTGNSNRMTAQIDSGSQEALDLAGKVRELGVTVLLNSTATSIVMEEGSAKGVKVSADGGEFTIYADKIIMAAGGASYDLERTLAADPELARVPLSRGASVGATGDGFRMLEEIGAEVVPPIIKPGVPDFALEYQFTFRNAPFSTISNSMVFDENGERFYNEGVNSLRDTLALLHHGSASNYVLYDASTLPESLTVLLERDDPKIIVQADTMEALAQKLSISPRALLATFHAYQEGCKNGEDLQFGKDAAHMVAYAEEGPYYAAFIMPGTFGTLGGAIIDEQMHVLNAETGALIPNLFAIGENATSRLFSDNYMGGYSHGYYRTMGVIAAETAVAEIAGE